MDKIPFIDRVFARLSAVMSFLFVRKCAVCNTALWKEENCLCSDCRKIWASAQRKRCPVCSKTALACRCRPISMTGTGRLGEKYVSSLSFYGKPDSKDEQDIVVRRLINALKQSPDRECVKFIGPDMARIILNGILGERDTTDGWYICCPPRTNERIKQYGFDHSREISERVSEYTGIPFSDCFENAGGTLQKTLNVMERRDNAKAAYRLKKGCDPTGHKFIIIDDIITTGATVNACAELLYGAGAETVFPVSVARTKPKKRKVRRKIARDLWFK